MNKRETVAAIHERLKQRFPLPPDADEQMGEAWDRGLVQPWNFEAMDALYTSIAAGRPAVRAALVRRMNVVRLSATLLASGAAYDPATDTWRLVDDVVPCRCR